MPTLFRFLMVVVIAGVVGYGLVYALATYVQPVTRPMVIDVPLTTEPPPATP